MAYRVAIVDDSQTDAEFVQGILNSWAEQRQVSIQGAVLPLPRGAYEPLNRAIIQHT